MYATVTEANGAVVKKIKEAKPFLVDVRPAHEVIPVLSEGKVLLHAGAPIAWPDMTGPMYGAAIGAAIFEGWCKSEDEAKELLASKDMRFMSAHDAGAVGPMAGIMSAHMPVLVAENREHGNRAFCNTNEGIGKVLRFGGYSEEVINKVRWRRDVLGPALSKALRAMPEGLDVFALIAKAIGMGDEFHSRNIAASALFYKTIMPWVIGSDTPAKDIREIATFLSQAEQFFLDIGMVAFKSVMDAAHSVGDGSIVTAMARNGRDFGIRTSGTGNEWFTAPVDTPKGVFFGGYSQADANPDIGDSAITETFGVGGMVTVASPGIVRAVGAGGLAEAVRFSNELSEIGSDTHPAFPVPAWDFRGITIGIDIRKVVSTGITPFINTGISHKTPGIGQIGVGMAKVPLECFIKALEALGKKRAKA
jgi:hypothetical protein